MTWACGSRTGLHGGVAGDGPIELCAPDGTCK